MPAAAPDDERRAGERVAKAIAAAGVCSRRDAERLIDARRVAVNGRVLTSPATLVGDGDVVTVDGAPLPQRPLQRLWRYHKPPDLVTTHRDPQGRATVFDRLPKELGRVISVGRLDLTAEGLLLLTNDGELARRIEHPSTGWVRRYRVRAHGLLDPDAIAALARGVTVDGERFGPIEVKPERDQGTNVWLMVSLKEGRNREVRRALESKGLQVTRLIRIAYGPFQLGGLVRGAVEEVPRKALREQLGRAIRPAPRR